MMPAERLPRVHPGEILMEEYVGPMDISQHRLEAEVLRHAG
jgi:plasmid maintenance system antidote protein VapI